MGKTKYNNLVIKDLEELMDQSLDSSRIELGLTVQEFEKILYTAEVFTHLEDKIIELVIDQQDDSYVNNWLSTGQHNQQAIVRENRKSFHYYILFVHASHLVFDRLNQEMRGQTVDSGDIVRCLLMGKLCKMVEDIGILLSYGSTKTALGLYRMVYEHAVIGVFLMKQDDEELYQKFADYGLKDSKKKADSMRNHFNTLKFPPVEPALHQQIDDKSTELREQYGKTFFDEYGWAVNHLKERPSFWAIEKACGMAQYRPFYIWASQYVHPSFQTIADIRNSDGNLDLKSLTNESFGIKSFIDPMQLTVNAMYIFLEHFLNHYSTTHQYSTNMLLFHKLFIRLQATFDTSED